MFLDYRSQPITYQTEILEDGFKEIGKNEFGDPVLVYYGTPALILKRTEKVLGTLAEYEAKRDEFRSSIESNNFWANEVITRVDGPTSEKVYVDNVLYYGGTIEYTQYPPLATYVPPPVIRNYSTPTNISGYTITGEPIISFRGRQRTVIESYTTSDLNSIPVSGSVANGVIYNSVNKNNYRVINGVLYVDVEMEYEELQGNYLVI